MGNVRWSVVVTEETNRALRSRLGATGARKGGLSRFVGSVSGSIDLIVEIVRLDRCRLRHTYRFPGSCPPHDGPAHVVDPCRGHGEMPAPDDRHADVRTANSRVPFNMIGHR